MGATLSTPLTNVKITKVSIDLKVRESCVILGEPFLDIWLISIHGPTTSQMRKPFKELPSPCPAYFFFTLGATQDAINVGKLSCQELDPRHDHWEPSA